MSSYSSAHSLQFNNANEFDSMEEPPVVQNQMNPNRESVMHQNPPGVPPGAPQVSQGMVQNQFTPEFLQYLLQGMSIQIGQTVSNAFELANANATAPPRPKLGAPEPFKGARKAYKSFIQQIRIVFEAEPRTYESDSVKISYLQSYVRGDALAWILSRREMLPNESFTHFEAALSAIFSDPFEKEDKIRRLQSLVQGKQPCANYTAEFRQVSTTLGLSNLDLCIRFYSGLASHVKDGLVLQNENYLDMELQDLMFLSVQIDNRNFDRQKDKTSIRSYSNQRYAPTTSPSSQTHFSRDDPMQLDVISSQHQYVPGKRITPEERQRRMDNGLCIICGEDDHLRNNCKLNRYNRPFSTPARSQVHFSSTEDSGKESTPQ